MEPFNKYLSGVVDSVAQAELERLTERYEWFTTARRANHLLTGKSDSRLVLPLMFSPTISPSCENNAKATPSANDSIIDRFLKSGGHRIIPVEGTEEDILHLPANYDTDSEESVTEELAEIYSSQGLYVEAKEIYRKLSLLNPEKSIYFASVIDGIDEKINNN